MRLIHGDFERGVSDVENAIRLNRGDAAARFESSSRAALARASADHGRQQVQAMLRDRPAMREHGKDAEPLYQWAARKFAGEDTGRTFEWDRADAAPITSAPDRDVCRRRGH